MKRSQNRVGNNLDREKDKKHYIDIFLKSGPEGDVPLRGQDGVAGHEAHHPLWTGEHSRDVLILFILG